ncbi:aminoglycoside phosphotransferase family protein [Halobacteriovorax sp.]|uniref:aminoglycoside phosphotransferase family protein n=1 Tax=Halobacteriovorax sp. TaxID=2020862 RepID=UPI00356AC68F
MRPEESERLLIEELFENTRARVKDFDRAPKEIISLTGDASTRRYYRVMTDRNSFVSCLSEPMENDKDNDFLNVYNIFSTSNVRVPKIYDHNIKKGYFLQEDLGNKTLLSHVSLLQSEDEIFATYKKIIDILVNIHKIPANIEYSWGSLKFDVDKFMFEMNFTKKYFIESFLDIELTTEESCLYDDMFKQLVEELSCEEMVLCHRDFHSRNIMMKDGEPVVIDFQDARQGVSQYDLVSMLEDCYFQLSADNIEKLKKYYIEQSFDENIDKEKFDRIYDLMTIQRTFKAIGSFAYINQDRDDNRYLKYIGFGMEKLRNKFKKYPEYRDLFNLIMSKYYES